METKHIPSRHLPKRKSWIIIGLFYVPLEFQPKIKTKWIFHHCIGYLNYISVLTNNGILLGLSKLLTSILSAIKDGLQSYCETVYSILEVSWHKCGYLKIPKDLLEYTQSNSFSSCNSIKTFDFSTLYTSIQHSKLKDKLKELVLLCFLKKEWPT